MTLRHLWRAAKPVAPGTSINEDRVRRWLPAGSPYPKADLRLRLLARLVDVSLVIAFLSLPQGLGVLAAGVFLLAADGLGNGQSPGKRLFGIKVVAVATRQSAELRLSARRNALFAVGVVPFLMPEPGAWVGLGLSALIALVEGACALRHPLGLRWGDRWAGTQVVDAKAVVRAAAPRPRAAAPAEEALR